VEEEKSSWICFAKNSIVHRESNHIRDRKLHTTITRLHQGEMYQGNQKKKEQPLPQQQQQSGQLLE
jgi:hypothetical protein